MIEQQQEDYPEAVQRLLLSFMISEPNSFSLCQNIIKPEYFDPKLKPAVRHVLEYAEAYRSLPTPDQIEAQSGLAVKKFEGADSPQHTEWFLKTVEGFCRYKALEIAIIEGVDLLQKGRGAEVERMVKEAMTISLMTDLGLDYFQDPLVRLERMRDRSHYFTTGWNTLDDLLNGGFTKGALNIFAGGSGSGKSLFLQNIALNWAMRGLNVIYFSLELSEDLVANRIDSMTSGLSTKEIEKHLKQAAFAISEKGKDAGDLRIKTLNQGATANDVRAYLKEYEIQTGRRADAIIMDYLDLMHPNDKRINISDQFIKDKYVSEELRGLAREMDCFCVTASQLNRQSVDAGGEFDHSHIAGGISKINTAGNVFGIFTTQHMRENGEYQLVFLKTRSSSAVGRKVKLKYRNDCLLILDPDDNESEMLKPKSPQELQQALKVKASIGGGPSPVHMETVEVEEGQSTSQRILELMKKARGQ